MIIGGDINIPVALWFVYIIILLISIFICCLIEADVIPNVPLPHLALIGIILPSYLLGWHTCAFVKYGESRKLNLNYTPQGFVNMGYNPKPYPFQR